MSIHFCPPKSIAAYQNVRTVVALCCDSYPTRLIKFTGFLFQSAIVPESGQLQLLYVRGLAEEMWIE